MNEVNSDELNIYGKDKKSNKIWIISGIILLLILAGFGIYYYFAVAHNSKSLFNKYVDKLYNVALDSIDEVSKNTMDLDITKDIVQIESVAKFDTDLKIEGLDLSKLKDYTFNSDVLLSLSDNKMYSNLSIKNGESNFLGIEALLSKDEVLLASKEIFNKVIQIPLNEEEYFEIDLEELDNVNMITPDETRYLTKLNKKYTLDFLKTLNYEGVSTKVDNKSAYKSTLTIDTKTYVNYFKGLLNTIKDDSKALEILKKYDIDKEIINSYIELFNEVDLEEESKVVLNLYTNPMTGSFKQFEIVADNNTALKITKDNSVYNFNIVDQVFTYDSSKKELNFEIEGLKVTLTFKDNQVDFKLKVNSEFKLEINGSINLVLNKNEYNINASLQVKTNALGEDNSFKLEVNTKTSKASGIKNIEGTKISVEEAGEYAEEIMTNLENKIKGSIFEDLINYMSSVSYEDYDYEYEYEF